MIFSQTMAGSDQCCGRTDRCGRVFRFDDKATALCNKPSGLFKGPGIVSVKISQDQGPHL